MVLVVMSSFFTTAEDSEVDSDKVDDGKAVLVFVAPEAWPAAKSTVCACVEIEVNVHNVVIDSANAVHVNRFMCISFWK